MNAAGHLKLEVEWTGRIVEKRRAIYLVSIFMMINQTSIK
jgi:hypothetical protein